MEVFNKIKGLISDYQESQALRESARLERIYLAKIAERDARVNFYVELITQSNININYIVAKNNTLQANLAGLGKRGFKDLKEKLNRELHQLGRGLEEERFLVHHYSKLRDEELQ